jgi:thiol:disulfide interchange protein DsbD
VALALSMLGVWTLNPPQALYAAEGKAPHTVYLGSFSNGLMATLLATPCSAPYLGAVLAWALTQPGWITVMMLGLVGLGMSLPYLLLAIFPDALKRVPRAGRWSDLLKQGLGIVMMGVAVYLLTLIPNTTYWPWVLMAGVVVALVCWAWGQLPTYNMEPARIWTIRVVSVVVGIGLGVGLYVMASRYVREIPRNVDDGAWRPFNVALLDDALKSGRPVVVDWTASWCINCHALEAFVLNTGGVNEAFVKSNALLLRADLSTDNPPATLLNRELGGEAIPVLAIFSPGRPREPVVLRDSYSSQRVIEEVGRAR